MSSFHCNTKKRFQEGILPCSDPLALQGPSASLPQLQNSIFLSCILSRGNSCSCFPSWVKAAQSELAYALYYTRCKTHQEQNRRFPVTLRTQKVCRENLQSSFSSSHKTNFKNSEPPVQKILLKLPQCYTESSYLERGFFSYQPLMFLSHLHECQ